MTQVVYVFVHRIIITELNPPPLRLLTLREPVLSQNRYTALFIWTFPCQLWNLECPCLQWQKTVSIAYIITVLEQQSLWGTCALLSSLFDEALSVIRIREVQGSLLTHVLANCPHVLQANKGTVYEHPTVLKDMIFQVLKDMIFQLLHSKYCEVLCLR
jgi:hypothetical protein